MRTEGRGSWVDCVGNGWGVLVVTGALWVAFGAPAAGAHTAHYNLLVSVSPTRSGPAPLGGAAVTGDIYVYATVHAGEDIDDVEFHLDDPERDDDPIRTEDVAPYDLAGTDLLTGLALPFDTRNLTDGLHSVTVLIDRDDNSDIELTASFTVNNPAVCGDGRVTVPDESCDDGNTIDEGNGCDAACQRSDDCGDGLLQALFEACDDGAGNSDLTPDACRSNCMLPGCGDGVTDAGEECDTGVDNSDTAPDACRTSCMLSGCGDDVTDSGEACDDGGESDECNIDCTEARCGDGVVNQTADEECDGAVLDLCPGPCEADCACALVLLVSTSPDRSNPVLLQDATVGGELYVFAAPAWAIDEVEFYLDDPGKDDRLRKDDDPPFDFVGKVSATGMARPFDSSQLIDGQHVITVEIEPDHGPDVDVHTTFTVHNCGDGVVQQHEACDDGASNSDTTPDACRTNCTLPGCGDGVTDTGEACDDSGESATCDVDCTAATCGDGTVNVTAAETCDDGDMSDTGNGCDASCHRNDVCGDGMVQALFETCDDGSAGNSDTLPDACRGNCTLPACGDGVTDAAEECDAGVDNSDTTADACRSNCVLPGCGDNVTDSGEACDDGGESDECNIDCTEARCGDGIVNATADEECDGTELGVCPGPCEADCACAFVLLVSTSPDRSNPVLLQDATVSGEVYVFAEPAWGIDEANFYLDDPGKDDRLQAEHNAPFDFAGTVVATGMAQPFDSSQLIDGEHVITVEIEPDHGPDVDVHTKFTVLNCGDGVVQEHEACDDGASNSDTAPDACRTSCTLPDCGDGVMDTGEACDDGGESATCDADCTAAGCGDGTINAAAGETCDDSGESATCDVDCTAVSCGDGLTNAAAGEACDDGGESATCDVDCTAAECGDGFTNGSAGEACDDSGANSDIDADACRTNCQPAACGDGVSDTGETCDDSGESATCNGDCSAAVCEDGKLNVTAGEVCDDGATNSDVAPDACRTSCQQAGCGDGVTDTGEGCDDGGESVACDVDCTVAACGDGSVNATSGETCDDGGESATCDVDCTAADCGDGTINAAAGEACDDSGESATCDADCTTASCGDGTENPTAGELCDDVGESSTCDADCSAVSCGDGTVNVIAGEACDTGGESAACDANCTSATCGDGTVNTAAGETCDAAGESAACDADCTLVACGDGIANTSAGEACDDTGESATCNADCTLAACGDKLVNISAGEVCDGVALESCPGTCDADCTCTSGPHTLMVSTSPDRSDPEPLHGASVAGDIYVFLNSGLPILRVRFYLNDDDQSGPPEQTEGKVPYDFAGTALAGTGNAFDTTELPDDAHTISAIVETAGGGSDVVAATFFVGNNTAALAFATSTMTFVVTEGGGTASQMVDLNTTDGAAAAYETFFDATWLDIIPASGVTPDSLTVSVDPTGLLPGTYTDGITASAPGFVSDALTVTLQVGDAGDCGIVPCSSILVPVPYVLPFDEDHGHIQDTAGTGTGFTYIDVPSNSAGYLPANVEVDTDAEVLEITTTAGLQYQGANALDNALGVGIDAPSHVSVLAATLLDPPAGTGNFEQAGLWFGNDEDNHVKLVVLSTSVGTKIQFLLEVDGQALAEKKTGVLDLTGTSVLLRLRIDPSDKSIQAAYQLDGEPIQIITTFVVPPEFLSFDAAGIDPIIGTRSFGGVFASHRNGPAPLVYTFDDFTVDAEVLVPSTGDITFTRTSATVTNPTSLAWGPDGRLYVTELLGRMHALTFGPDKTLVDDEIINTLTLAAGARLTLGLAIDPASTPEDVVLWVSHSSPSLGNGAPNSGMVSRLSGPGFSTVEHVITGLPRAKANHAVSSIHFGPDGRLYIAAGGNTGAGAPNQANTEFGEMAEQPLSAALLVADVFELFGDSFDGSCHNPEDIFGPPPCDVMPYATGMRNMYDFVFHTNGSLYGPDNGLGVTGTYPTSPSSPCLGFGDPAPFNAIPPGHNPGEQPDILLRVVPGLYYGHPNPSRSECVFKNGSFQGVAPLPNWSPALFSLGNNRSANGIIEYANDEEFCGALRGDLLIANFSVGDDLTRIQLSTDGASVLESESLVGGFANPLSLAQDPDGTVYVAEFGASQVTALVPTRSGCWAPVASVPEAILDAGGAALDGKLYMVGGKTVTGPVSSVNVYDPQTDMWAVAPDLPGAAVENPAVVAHDGLLYAFGGSTAAFSGAVTNAAVFDPVTPGWTPLAPMPTSRGGATAQVIDGLIYVVGGLDGTGASLATVDVYDPGADTWDVAAPMSTRRDNPGSAVLDGALYVFGGRTRNADGIEINGTLATVEMYDPTTDTWIDRAPMPTGRRTVVVGTLSARAQVIGGERTPGGDTFPQNEEYDPVTDTWRSLASMLTPRHGAAGATIDGVVYVAGGGPAGGFSLSDVNEAFLF